MYADDKDLKRAKDLGKHSGAVYANSSEIARGKASSMAAAITDKRKILGRLEAVASIWSDYDVLYPFIQKCVRLWPNSQYEKAYSDAKNQSSYLNNEIKKMGISRDYILKKYLISNESGGLSRDQNYEFDDVSKIIFNTLLKKNIRRW